MVPTGAALLAIVVAVIVAVVVRTLLRPKQSPSATFKCARCSSVSRHTKRTAEAWRRNAKALFCDSCHRKWLETRPRQPDGVAHGPPPTSSGRGCLGVMLLLALIPVGLLTVALYA
jgi:hypothetical protein